MTQNKPFLGHRLLDELPVLYGFGVRGAEEPEAIVRPVQVHGSEVAVVDAAGNARPREADALLSTRRGIAVAVVTADCVPILAATENGREVVAIHAGWRGLAQGVVGAGIDALHAARGSAAPLRAVLGPHIGSCCYEVDAPVLESLCRRFGDEAMAATRPSRPDHAMLDLAYLVELELKSHGIAAERLGTIVNACTHCDEARFYSYRREGPRAGRLLHFIQAANPEY
ncbi:MAG: peptidoglycan editing factor PgeF [Myxococcota bacterium]